MNHAGLLRTSSGPSRTRTRVYAAGFGLNASYSRFLLSSARISARRSDCSSKAFCPGALKQRKQQWPNYARRLRIARLIPKAQESLVPLGLDFLTFLGSTVLIIPLFRSLKASPVLGFLFSGLMLQQLGLFQDLHDIEKLSELGVLFLLFEMGLELSLDRLKALAKYAFGMGTLQVAICTLAFTAFALPVGHGFGTIFLEKVVGASPSLVSIRSVDEAVVIGAALSMSSSAFVLQLLQERGEMCTRFGSATLGILLFQDIAVVPFLVLLPLVEGGGASSLSGATPISLVQALGPTALQTLAGLGGLLLGGKFVLKRIFEMVAESRNSETFVALCLLTVTGAAFLTQKMGFSDTLGAFIAGVLLSETSYRTQVEADIKPFRGLLLGLFFVSVGSTINMDVLLHNWDIVFWMVIGLVGIKVLIMSLLGPQFGLSRSESVRTAFMLSQGGEFAFVLLSLANQLQVLPENLNQILIIVVVLSMALTPGLAEMGKKVGEGLDKKYGEQPAAANAEPIELVAVDPVVICGFGAQGQMLANMLETPLAHACTDCATTNYVAFDLDPARVRASRKAGFNVVFGDGSRTSVLKAAGVKRPRVFVIAYNSREQAVKAVESVRSAFPRVPVYACAVDMRHAAELEEKGASNVVITGTEAGLALGSVLLEQMGASERELSFLRRGIEEAIGIRRQVMVQSLVSAAASQPEVNAPEVFVLDTERRSSSKRMSSTSMLPAEAACVSVRALQTSDASAAAVGGTSAAEAEFGTEHTVAAVFHAPAAASDLPLESVSHSNGSGSAESMELEPSFMRQGGSEGA